MNKAWQALRDIAARGFWLLGFGLALALSACSDSSPVDCCNPPPPQQAAGTVSGRVLSSSTGAGLSGVKIKAGSVSIETASDGSYSLPNVPAGDPTPISFERSGYAPGFASVRLVDKGSAVASPQLVPVSATQSFSASAAGTLSVAGSTVRVDLPAGSLVNKSTGAAASGTVTAELTVIDPATSPASMPGNYTAATAGGTQAIESFGAINVTLKDAAGNALNLASGQRATIRIPVSTRSAVVPATIPLYYFNETTGLWVQEGTATLAGTAPNRYYEGTVSHFSYWNADQAAETVKLPGCVQDSAGAPVQGVLVSTDGIDYSGGAGVLTDAQGKFSVSLRKDGKASVFGELGARATNIVTVGPSSTDLPAGPCLVLGALQAPQILSQPQSQTAEVNSFAVFEVRAQGSGVLRYQWTRGGVPLAGATGSSLFLLSVQDSDAGIYRVVITGEGGTLTSEPATLTVPLGSLPPLIVTQPQAVEAVAGQTASFSVQAVSQGGALSYQWRRGSVDLPGATSPSYTTPVLALGDGALYSVLVSSSNGTSVRSAAVQLTVVAAPTAPSISTQPQSTTVGVGQAASFSVVAAGSPTLRYQWKRNGIDIAGATGTSYTTAATVQADDGAVFSVVVTNDVASTPSANATLRVTTAVGQGGYYLVSTAGPMVQGTVSYADGVQTLNSPALLAVSPANPLSVPVTLKPAGQGGRFATSVFEATVSGGLVSNLRSRYSVFVLNNRFNKVDQVVASGGLPTPQVFSSLSTASLCGTPNLSDLDFNSEGTDLADPSRSWLFMRAPGADGQCDTADDSVKAVRLNMSDTTPALDLGTAFPVAGVRNGIGALTGLLVRNGTQVQLLNAELGGASTLFSVSADFDSGAVVAGGSAPGVWFHSDAGKVWAVNLSAPTTRQSVATLATGESLLGLEILGGNGEFFVPIRGTTGTRVLRVTAALVSSPLVSFTQTVQALMATDTHLVASLGTGGAQAVPRTGGTPTPLLSLAAGESVGQVLVGASTVALNVSRFDLATLSQTSRVVLVNSDGSNLQNLAGTALVGSVNAEAVPLADSLGKTFAIFVVDPVAASGSQAGATVRAIRLDNRSPLFTYGTLPSAPDGLLLPSAAGPFQYGQPGLFTFVGTSDLGISELYYFDSDAAGLVRVTSFVTAAGRSAPAKLQPRMQKVRL